jgi:hypothetical protein
MRTSFLCLPLLTLLVSANYQQYFVARNLQTITSIYNLTVYPNNVPIIQDGASAVPAGLFSQNATGRISPVGNFSGFQDSIEYFFGLAPVPQANSGSFAFYNAQIVEFTSGCPEVAASVAYLSAAQVDPNTGAPVPGSVTTMLKQVAFWHFDKTGAVLKYDAWIPNLAVWTALVNGIDYSNPFIQTATINAICPVIQQRCNGTNQQYSSVAQCVSTLESKPFGNYDETWGDNVSCRSIHLILTQIRPVVHCPHVGPVGGNGPNNYKCTNIDYRVEYFDDVQLFQEPEGTPFMCPRMWAKG